jgi:hypothetical protein
VYYEGFDRIEALVKIGLANDLDAPILGSTVSVDNIVTASDCAIHLFRTRRKMNS